jgi:hypothetical protein
MAEPGRPGTDVSERTESVSRTGGLFAGPHERFLPRAFHERLGRRVP